MRKTIIAIAAGLLLGSTLLTACGGRQTEDVRPTPTAVPRLALDSSGNILIEGEAAPSAEQDAAESAPTEQAEEPAAEVPKATETVAEETAEATQEIEASEPVTDTPTMAATEAATVTLEAEAAEVVSPTVMATETTEVTETSEATVTEAATVTLDAEATKVVSPTVVSTETAEATATETATETQEATATDEATPVVEASDAEEKPAVTPAETVEPTASAEPEPAASETPTPDAEASSPSATPVMGAMGMGMGAGGGMGPGNQMRTFHNVPIPSEYAGMVSPIEADADSLARGKEKFDLLCATCHGETGLGDGPAGAALDPSPPSIAMTSQMLGDDYLFWRISEGGAMEPFNSAMISWKGTLSEEQRWDVINYVRSLGRNMPDMMGANTGAAGPGTDAEAAMRAEMLAAATEQGLITEDEATVFDTVHEQINQAIAADPDRQFTGTMRDLQDQLLEELVADGTIAAEDADAYNNVHLILEQSELMP